MQTEYVEFDSVEQLMSVFGSQDAHIGAIEQALQVTVMARDSRVEIKGGEENVKTACDTLETLKKMYDKNGAINDWMVSQAMELVRYNDVDDAFDAMTNVVAFTHRGKPVKCKTAGQKRLVDAIAHNTVTVCIGPAGTGKTYLAIAMAVAALKKKEITRIILTRPAIEAGEKLGFLPGDMQNKVDPYLRPLYDALHEFLGIEQFQRHVENGVIEIAPIAYMRGRTLSDAMVVADECQNMTLDIHRLLLTRLGEGAKMVLTGDITQTDLLHGSGLEKCAEIVKDIEGIAVVNLSNRDVVRHKLVKEIIKAFEKYDSKTNRPNPRLPHGKKT